MSERKKEEQEWTKQLKSRIESALGIKNSDVVLQQQLPYAFEIISHDYTDKPKYKKYTYATDVLICEMNKDEWIPRVVIEVKYASVTTHDAITYSQKAYSHKFIYPYLRYGMIVGNMPNGIPGRVIRHGLQFDFIISTPTKAISDQQLEAIVKILRSEWKASRVVEAMHYDSRKKDRDNYVFLHRKLVCK